MTEMEDKKVGLLDKLFLFFSKDVKVTMLVLLTLLCAYFIRKSDASERKLSDIQKEMYERVISEVKGEVKKQVEPIKAATDSTSARVDTSLSGLDAVTKDLKTLIKNKKK